MKYLIRAARDSLTTGNLISAAGIFLNSASRPSRDPFRLLAKRTHIKMSSVSDPRHEQSVHFQPQRFRVPAVSPAEKYFFGKTKPNYARHYSVS
jgi:hypothetical protein